MPKFTSIRLKKTLVYLTIFLLVSLVTVTEVGAVKVVTDQSQDATGHHVVQKEKSTTDDGINVITNELNQGGKGKFHQQQSTEYDS